MFYPISLNLKGKKAVLVGAGHVAHRKCKSLLLAEAKVHLIAPEISDEIRALSGVTIKEARYQKEDLADAFIVFAASNQKEVNDKVAEDCREEGVLFSRVDQAGDSDFHSSAHFQRGDLHIAVHSAGKSPAGSRAFKNYLNDKLPDNIGDYIDFLQAKRQEIKDKFQDAKRLSLLKKLSDKQAFVLLEEQGLSAAQDYITKVIEENV